MRIKSNSHANLARNAHWSGATSFFKMHNAIGLNSLRGSGLQESQTHRGLSGLMEAASEWQAMGDSAPHGAFFPGHERIMAISNGMP